MFVHDFEVVETPFERVVEAFDADPEALILAALDDVRRSGEHVLAKVKPKGWPVLLAKRVEVQVGAPRMYGDGALVWFAWSAVGGASLFPSLQADLEFAPFGENQTELTLRGNYEPPGGGVGRQLDQLLLHRIADSTVRAVLRSLCTALDTGVTSAPVRPTA